jgi:hypothetical protein
VCHHALPNARHASFCRLDGRNRVLLARRNLPWPIATLLFDWLCLTLMREHLCQPSGPGSPVRGGLADECRAAAADAGQDGPADDPRGAPSDRVTWEG